MLSSDISLNVFPSTLAISVNEVNSDSFLYFAKYPEPEQKAFFESHYVDDEDATTLKDAINFFGDRNYKVKSFPWNIDKTFKGLPKCSDCTDRSSCQNVLFPVKDNPEDTCLNKQCMESKIKLNLPDVIKETKKLGKTILIEGDSYPRYRYYEGTEKIVDAYSVRKASEKQKEFLYGVVVSADSIIKIGSVHKCTLVTQSDSPGRSSKTKMQDLPIEEQYKRRVINYKRKKDLILFPKCTAVGKELTKHIKKVNYKKIKNVPTPALAVIADFVLDQTDWNTRGTLSKIYNPKKDKKNLAKILLMLVTASTFESFINVNDEHYANSDRYKRLAEIAPVLGIDVKAIEKTIQPKYDEKITTLKEKFIGRNKFDPEKGLPKTKKAADKKTSK